MTVMGLETDAQSCLEGKYEASWQPVSLTGTGEAASLALSQNHKKVTKSSFERL